MKKVNISGVPLIVADSDIIGIVGLGDRDRTIVEHPASFKVIACKCEGFQFL